MPSVNIDFHISTIKVAVKNETVKLTRQRSAVCNCKTEIICKFANVTTQILSQNVIISLHPNPHLPGQMI